MNVSGVSDLAGNTLVNPVTWRFSLPALSQTRVQSSSTLSGLKFNVKYQASFASDDSTFRTNISKSLSNYLNVPVSRFANITVSNATDGDTLVALTILPPSARREGFGNLLMRSTDELRYSKYYFVLESLIISIYIMATWCAFSII
jgi:hypothetical protein